MELELCSLVSQPSNRLVIFYSIPAKYIKNIFAIWGKIYVIYNNSLHVLFFIVFFFLLPFCQANGQCLTGWQTSNLGYPLWK